MAITYSLCNSPISGYLPYQNPASISMNSRAPDCAGKSSIVARSYAAQRRSRRFSIVAAIGNGGGSDSLSAPLVPTSSLGRSLCRVLLNNPYSFYDAASAELSDLAVDRDDAFDRMEFSVGTPEACLHRRIAELKEAEQMHIVEDIMYMIIYKKFKDIKVPLIPKIDKYVHDCRLEILPSMDNELQSIHSDEVMGIIKGYLNSVLGCKLDSNASFNLDPVIWERVHLCEVYSSSIFYGYFLKSASVRHRLERYMNESYLELLPSDCWPFVFGSGFYGIRNIALGEFSSTGSKSLNRVQSPKSKPPPNLKSYVQGFDQDALRICKETGSQVSSYLAQDHCLGLFSPENSFLIDHSEVFLIPLAGLKRLILEAIAFGCFLWDAEQYVDRVYNLRKNLKSTRIV